MPESGILERRQHVVPMAPAAGPRSRAAGSALILQALALAGFTLGSLSVIWVSLGDHPLHSHSEGRYACVAEVMAEGGSWLIPQLDGRPHLTKPPLTYWLEALSLRCFGHNEFAVRLPSAMAGSLTALALLALGWRLGGPKHGMLAMGILLMTPLHVTMSRLTLTDSLMGLFWFGILAGGFLCLAGVGRKAESGKRKAEGGRRLTSRRFPLSAFRLPPWPCVLLWVSFALGMLTKAPLSIIPLGVVVVWAVVSGRGRELRRLHPGWGLPLALLPFAVWVVLVVRLDPTVPGLWYDETIGRAVGTGDHRKPFWFYLPVFFAGLFPATAIMRIPGWHVSWRSAWRTIREGSPRSLWMLSVVLPLLFFSICRGKHFSYILPLAPPLALLSAGLLKELLCDGSRIRENSADCHRDGRILTNSATTDPPVALTVFLACLATVVALGVTTKLFDSSELPLHWLWAPVLLLTAAAGWQWWTWQQRPAARHAALVTVWVMTLAVWYTASEVEDVHFDALSTQRLIERIRRDTGERDPLIETVGLTDSTISFYMKSAKTSRGDVLNIPDTIGVLPPSGQKVLVAEPVAWKRFSKADPQAARRFGWRWTWDRGRWKSPLLVLYCTHPAGDVAASKGHDRN